MSEKKYFDADTAYDSGTLHNWYIDSVSENDSPVWTEEHIDELINDFYIIPRDTKPADAAPVVHGHWIKRYLEETGRFDLECSNCKFRIVLDKYDMQYARFCNNCGAKMDESEGER